MDYITSKVFVVALGIFISITIMTGVIFVFTIISDVYESVENTDISILNQYDNIHSVYSGATVNTIGVINALRRYDPDAYVDIYVSFNIGDEPAEIIDKSQAASQIESDCSNESIDIDYEDLYDVAVIQQDDGHIKLTFSVKEKYD